MDYMKYIRSIRSASLSYKAKLVAIIIASHYDFSKKKPAFPSVALLAQETGLSERSISRAKTELIETGWLVSHRQYNAASLSVPSCPTGELNTHINTHLNNKEKDSNESLVNFINVNQDDIDTSFEVVKDSMSPATAEWLMSW